MKFITANLLSLLGLIILDKATVCAGVDSTEEELPYAIGQEAPTEGPIAVAQEAPTEGPIAVAEEAPTGPPIAVAEEAPTEPPVAVGAEAPSETAGARGDPHFKTWKGEKYDFHGVCDLILLHNPGFDNGVGMDIHIRTMKTRQWSYISTAVLQIGEDTLEVMGGNDENRYWINKVIGEETGEEAGEATTLKTNIAGFPIRFRQVNAKQREFVVDLNNGVMIIFKTWNKFVRVDVVGAKSDNFGSSVGMMGTFHQGWKTDRDNSTIINDLLAFGQEWQVRSADPKLFHSMEGPQYPEKCAIPSATTIRRRLGESLITQEEALVACSRVNGEDRDLCIFDVMATNDKNVAGAY